MGILTGNQTHAYAATLYTQSTTCIILV